MKDAPSVLAHDDALAAAAWTRARARHGADSSSSGLGTGCSARTWPLHLGAELALGCNAALQERLPTGGG